MFGVGYDVLYDLESPPYFYPPQCTWEGTFVDGMNRARNIAIVGEYNEVSKSVHDYMKQLFDY
jgi:hypothetical protein